VVGVTRRIAIVFERHRAQPERGAGSDTDDSESADDVADESLCCVVACDVVGFGGAGATGTFSSGGMLTGVSEAPFGTVNVARKGFFPSALAATSWSPGSRGIVDVHALRPSVLLSI
jgi:hypothetical protein